jgi:serine/threonine protein kinase
LAPEEKQKFLAIQGIVDTDVLHLEKNLNREMGCKHVHFRHDEDVPFEQRGRLGKGAFGVVHKVQSRISHKFYARKQTSRSWIYLQSKEEVIAFKRERDAMMKLSHRHCIEFASKPHLCLYKSRANYCLYTDRKLYYS